MKLLIRIILGTVIVFLIGVIFIYPTIFSFLGQKIYWIELLFLLLISFGYNISNTLILKIALLLTIVGALLNVLAFAEISETILRVTLVIWVVGVIKTLIKYRQYAKD